MKRGLKIAIFIAVIVGVIWLLTSLFSGGSKSTKTKTKTTGSPTALTEYANRDSKVVLTIDGRINGDDAHRSIRITVSRGTRMAEIIQGYQGNIISSQSQDNNPNAYDEFIRSLAKTGYGRERTSAVTDVRGICPTGQRYIFEVVDKNELVSRTWSATCSKGTSMASYTPVINLFKAQITDYSKFTSTTNL